MQPIATTATNSGLPVGRREDEGKDMTPYAPTEEWTGLIGGLNKFLAEEVGEAEHADDEEPEPYAAGVMFVTPGSEALFVRRGPVGDCEGQWAWPGGKVEAGETGRDAAIREAMEEVGLPAALEEGIPDDRRTVNGVDFATYRAAVPRRVPVKLPKDGEHTDYQWRRLSDPPQPLHPGVAATLADDDAAADETVLVRAGSVFGGRRIERDALMAVAPPLARGLIQSGFAERVTDPGIDEKPPGPWPPREVAKVPDDGHSAVSHHIKIDPKVSLDAALRIALDRDTVRSTDKDGRMRVAVAHISKANVCPYVGNEIPGWEELGLDPDRIYKLLRAPDELAKAAPTFNGVQVLKRHVPVSAEDHRAWDIVGTTGTEASFSDPYLDNSLVIWSQEGRDMIESGDQKELSCGYHYVPDMAPGTYKGERYDGVMRDIVGNHVALVTDGRAGPDVVVSDGLENVLWALVEHAIAEGADDV